MIVFDLLCREQGHRFEGWFGSSAEFADQQARGLVSCPQCDSRSITKALMAPNLARKGNQAPLVRPSPDQQVNEALATSPSPAGQSPAIPQPTSQPMASGMIPPEALRMMEKLATLQAKALEQSRWVGNSFAEESRAQHYGERDAEIIHGQATPEQARDLLEEGIAVMPLPFPVAPPDQTN
jgi:hypothetical protein